MNYLVSMDATPKSIPEWLKANRGEEAVSYTHLDVYKRQQLLNRTLDPEVSCINSILTTHGNYGVSLALPRVGEVWRVATMSHYSGIGFGRLLGTLFVDRIFDVIVLVVLAVSYTHLDVYKRQNQVFLLKEFMLFGCCATAFWTP